MEFGTVLNMQPFEFSNTAEQILLFIANTIETVDHQGLIDVDFHDDILNITTNKGVFVINKHSATMQIWLASPISGPHHFSYITNQWLSSQDVELFETLTNELQIAFNN